MPTRNVVLTERQTALCDAARVGLDDLEAGRFTIFSDRRDLANYLSVIAEQRLKAIATE